MDAMRRAWRTVAALLLAGAAGCKESPGPAETGLPPDALIVTLSGEQWATFCRVADDISRMPPEEECRRLAFSETRNVAVEGTDEDVRATCRARYDACVREIRPRPPRGPICNAGPPGIDCTASIAEAEQCLAAIHERRRTDREKIPSCSTVTAEQSRAAAGTMEVDRADLLLALPQCTPFQQKCPGLIR
jgi:hypothetical protein